jgi:hypothetical protein
MISYSQSPIAMFYFLALHLEALQVISMILLLTRNNKTYLKMPIFHYSANILHGHELNRFKYELLLFMALIISSL